ncbi:MAG: TonB-dependent receptor [Bacteroidetes bacterium]|nr:TonB-dependent receptor [Bacteroidota bacterium]
MRLLLFCIPWVLSLSSFGQGSIAGKIKDAKTGEAVVGANVVIVGTTQGAATDVEGNFMINNVREGTYTLQVTSVMYKPHSIPDVKVETAKRITIDIEVHEDVSELEEVVVTGKRQTGTDFDLLKSIKESKVVVVGITSEFIAKTLDRDASQVLRRVPGVTIRGEQFVQIRGLSERYNPVMLHNAYAPSVETDVRSFSFATLPSNQLDKMLVYKSPAADIPGDFGGGVVKVFTKSIPDENSFVIDYSTWVREGTTFQTFYQQEHSATHFTGFNTGYYSLPAGFPANVSNVQGDALVSAGRSLKNLWTPQKTVAVPDQRLNLTFSRRFSIGKVEVGNVSALTYSNAFAKFDVQRNDYTTTPGGGQDQNFGYADKQYNQLIRTGFLFNWAFKFSPNHHVEFKNMYNQSSQDQWVDRTGTGISEGQLNGSFDKVYRSIYSGQLLGTHQFFEGRTTVEWLAGYNKSGRNQPDYKRYRSQYDAGVGKASIIVPNTVTPDLLGRFYSNVDESAYSGGLSIRQLIGGKDPLKSPEIKAGFFFENKDRSFAARNIGYVKAGTTLNPNLRYATPGELFQPQNINLTDGIIIGELTYKKDSYAASNHLMASYVMTSVPFAEKFKLDAGVRIEDNLQKLNSYDDFKQQPVNVNNQVNRLLPSANLSYNFTEKMLVRVAYGETLNRPEFRELAPFSFYDFNFNFLYFGNPGLKTARIQNYDARWELYPSKNELITFGAFYKYFQDPIESIVDTNSPGGGVKNVTFANADHATSYGVEMEVRKSLSGLTGSKVINNLSMMFNATLIKSVIRIPAYLAANREAERPLQGQAPYVINAGVFYDEPMSGWQFNLLYNVVGKNIVFVGNDSYPDVYLMPRNVIDFTFNKRLSEHFNLRGGVSDILNQRQQFLQDGNGDGKWNQDKDPSIQNFRPGRLYSIGFTYRM